MPTFDLTKPLYASAGVADLAITSVKEYAAYAQKRIAGVQESVTKIDLTPDTLRETLTEEAKTRRAAIEARVAELQAELEDLPKKLQSLLDDNVATATSTYADLAKRGQGFVGRIRSQEATQAAVAEAKTTVSKAKTTTTQAKKATKSTASTAKKSASTTKKTAAKKSAPVKSSAKATSTAAKKTAAAATEAATDAVDNV